MHVNAKKIAIAGLLAAISVVLVILSSVIEMSSLFFIIAASYCVGIVIREWGVLFGIGFWIASTLVQVFVAPNKLYCMTFAMISFYLLASEFLWEKIAEHKTMKYRKTMFWIGRYLIFNSMYLLILILFPKLLFLQEMNSAFMTGVFLAGQVGLFVYEQAYQYFQSRIWGRVRIKLMNF